MPHHMNSYSHEEILTLLKGLPEEDRILLGLYIYEKLSDQQVKSVLNRRREQTKIHLMERESI